MNNRIEILVQWIDEQCAIDTVIWATSDDSCVNREYFPTLFQAVKKLEKRGEAFAIFDGHKFIERNVS